MGFISPGSLVQVQSPLFGTAGVVVVLVVIFGKGIGMMSLQMLAEGIINWKLQLPLLVLLALVIVFYVMYRRRQM